MKMMKESSVDYTESDVESITGDSKLSAECSNSESHAEKIAVSETRAVMRLKVLVFIVLLLAATSVSVTVYLLTHRSEIDYFESKYNGLSDQVIDAFEGIVKQKFGVIGSLRVSLIAHSIDSNQSFPFVKVSSFPQRAEKVKSLSESVSIGIYPLVNDTNRIEWEKFCAEEGPAWMEESLVYQSRKGLDMFGKGYDTSQSNMSSSPIRYINSRGTTIVDPGPGPYMPASQVSPLTRDKVNHNFLRNDFAKEEAKLCITNREALIGGFQTAPNGDISSEDLATSNFASLLSIAAQGEKEYQGDPFSYIYLPVFNSFSQDDQATVALLVALFPWAAFFRNVLPRDTNGIICVLENPCQGPFTYRLEGKEAKFLGKGDLHEDDFNYLEKEKSFAGLKNIEDGTEYGMSLQTDYCPVSVRLYPSKTFFEESTTNSPIMMAFTVAIIFLFTGVVFFLYDWMVERRQNLVLTQALQSNAIVSSLFPKNVRDRLLNEANKEEDTHLSNNKRLKTFLNENSTRKLSEEPIADLFPNATVLFADIAGFTAWSSTREPAQVFILLQAIYQAFDKIAKRRKVFKVETIGDSYVAVTGLPDPQENHAVIMSRFASDCLSKIVEVTSQLETTLGPDTGELSMRVGIHSGPVTAGVLRGERARFQLFGDTVNTAARMESNGIRGKIQISQSTADLLTISGKGHWIEPRSECVKAKGKGYLKTFWLNVKTGKGSRASTASSQTGSSDSDNADVATNSLAAAAKTYRSMKKERYINWTCELLLYRIKQVVQMRGKTVKRKSNPSPAKYETTTKTIPMDEVVEAITLPKFDEMKNPVRREINGTQISPLVSRQLRTYVSTIAAAYHDNPFHNFEHACHVTMSVNKLLQRVVTPDRLLDKIDVNTGSGEKALASHLHDYTHGITSDPITQLAVVLGAIVHDVDHRGCSNTQLMKEEEGMAKLYAGKSVAEQNSLDIAWALLMSEPFTELRNCIFVTEQEMTRFRQVIVNVVLATDIFDKELNDLRRKRWNKAFSAENAMIPGMDNLQATIVIEHMIQASDVAHTMQHWHVYRKWNRHLFREMYLAYKAGRMASNPHDFWYQGELGFFDNYIIPLAKKLKDCRVFGVSSDEYLNYAEKNRAEWEERGQSLVEEMMNEILASEVEVAESAAT